MTWFSCVIAWFGSSEWGTDTHSTSLAVISSPLFIAWLRRATCTAEELCADNPTTRMLKTATAQKSAVYGKDHGYG